LIATNSRWWEMAAVSGTTELGRVPPRAARRRGPSWRAKPLVFIEGRSGRRFAWRRYLHAVGAHLRLVLNAGNIMVK